MKKIVFLSCLTVTVFVLTVILSIAACSTRRPSEGHLLAYARAQKLYGEGRFSEAAALLEGDFPQALTLRGKAHFFAGDDKEAERVLRRALKKEPRAAEAAVFLARLLRERGETDEAMSLAETVIGNDPQDLRALRLAASLSLDRGPAGEEAARAFLDRAVEASAEAALVFLERAKLRWRSGDREGALSDLRRAGGLLPDDSPLNRAAAGLRDAVLAAGPDSAATENTDGGF